MRGWFHESYRHYLAAKGVATIRRKYRKEFPDFVRRFPNESPRITGEYARFRQESPGTFEKGSFRTKEVGEDVSIVFGKRKRTGEFGVQSFLIRRHPRYWVDKSRMEEFADAARMAEARGLDEFSFGAHSYRVKDAREILGGVHDSSAYLASKRGWEDTDHREGAVEYAERNLRSSNHGDRLGQFSSGVGRMIRHPWRDLDGEWQEYTAVADNDYYGPRGESEPLSKDMMGRSVQRGAALFGRVVSQANVEPLIDQERGRTFRETMMDIEFGRRMG
jgi:hypothetical protein